MDPYFIMWKVPKSDRPEFALIQPFTPKNRQVLIGWMAGMCDGPNYGRLLAFRFPKEQGVLRTQRVDTKIDQDARLKEQMTLWDQHGSRVIRGNVLVIPIAETLLYVEPIYIQADQAAYPELRVVVTMMQEKMSYASTFDEALRGLVRPQPAAAGVGGGPEPPQSRADELGATANQAFDSYLRLLGERRFEEAARQLDELSKILDQMRPTGAAPAAAPSAP